MTIVRRIPVFATLVVAAAMATMMMLGVWQLHRARWKEALLARYAAASSLPPVALPNVPDARNPPLYRHTSALCLRVVAWRAVAGRNATGTPGWSHVADCTTGAEGPGLSVDIGWSSVPGNPRWTGGAVRGQLAPDRRHVYRLVALTPAPGLQPSAPPSLDEIPNNHRAYAAQWFIFSAVAGIVYAVALRRRLRG